MACIGSGMGNLRVIIMMGLSVAISHHEAVVVVQMTVSVWRSVCGRALDKRRSPSFKQKAKKEQKK